MERKVCSVPLVLGKFSRSRFMASHLEGIDIATYYSNDSTFVVISRIITLSNYIAMLLYKNQSNSFNLSQSNDINIIAPNFMSHSFPYQQTEHCHKTLRHSKPNGWPKSIIAVS